MIRDLIAEQLRRCAQRLSPITVRGTTMRFDPESVSREHTHWTIREQVLHEELDILDNVMSGFIQLRDWGIGQEIDAFRTAANMRPEQLATYRRQLEWLIAEAEYHSRRSSTVLRALAATVT